MIEPKRTTPTNGARVLALPHPLQRQTIVPGPTTVLKGARPRRGTHQSLELVHVGQLEGPRKRTFAVQKAMSALCQ